jgi:DNA invertase Pin-like site-specific DNA recombinase
VVTKLDRLARSLPDARAIADELAVRQVRLNLGGPSTIRPILPGGCS